MATEIVSAQQLRELLDYNADTGVFTRLVSVSSRAQGGDVAGCKSNGYIVIRIFGKSRYAHRLAWLHVHGEWPVGHIDHMDGCGTNNRIANLRDVTHSTNMQNMIRATIRSTNGFLGVMRSRKRWEARILVDGKRRYLGQFDTPELAHAAYLEAKRRLHEGCTI